MTLDEIRAAADRELIENPPPPLTDRQVVNLRAILGLSRPASAVKDAA